MFYFSKLLGQPIRDTENRHVGVPSDLVVTTRTAYPLVTALVVKRRNRQVLAPWVDVTSFEESGVLQPAREHPRRAAPGGR